EENGLSIGSLGLKSDLSSSLSISVVTEIDFRLKLEFRHFLDSEIEIRRSVN
ncbi:10949_t:CDS:1, partial [Funneliformis geosporum]